MRSRYLLGTCLLILLVSGAPALRASDHADPVINPVLEAGLTDLFAFPEGDRLIVILCARRALSAPAPYQLEPYEYTIYMDLQSRISYASAEDRARYGGTVVRPEAIRANVTLRFRLNNNATLRSKTFAGLQNPERILVWTGVRDDPFTFPRFFGTNTIAMVLSIPYAAFPAGEQDWLIWGTTTRVEDGEQIDHVGRSNRTQLGRFDFLNTLPPSRHLAAIHDEQASRARLQQRLGRFSLTAPLIPLVQLVFDIRHDDLQPDVMIYTRRFPSGYPNGRRLTDDVALLTCAQGDCALIELAFRDSKQWPRATTNDKPFLAAFPYLAAPWPTKPPAPAPRVISTMEVVVVLVLLLLLVLSLLVWLCRWWCRRSARA